MNIQRQSRMFGDFFSIIGSAIAVASATEVGRRPHARDLRRLGIDPEGFRGIRRF